MARNSKKCVICGEILYGTGNMKHIIMNHLVAKHIKWITPVIFPIYRKLEVSKNTRGTKQ